jgi:hypothetical protein
MHATCEREKGNTSWFDVNNFAMAAITGVVQSIKGVYECVEWLYSVWSGARVVYSRFCSGTVFLSIVEWAIWCVCFVIVILRVLQCGSSCLGMW